MTDRKDDDSVPSTQRRPAVDEADFSGVLEPLSQESPPRTKPEARPAPARATPDAADAPVVSTRPAPSGSRPPAGPPIPAPGRLPMPRSMSPSGVRAQPLPRPAVKKPAGPTGFDDSEIDAALVHLSDVPPPREEGAFSSAPPPRSVPPVEGPHARSKPGGAPPPLPSRRSSGPPPLPTRTSVKPPLPSRKPSIAPPAEVRSPTPSRGTQKPVVPPRPERSITPGPRPAAPRPAPSGPTHTPPTVPATTAPRTSEPAPNVEIGEVSLEEMGFDASESPTLQDVQSPLAGAPAEDDEDDRITTIPGDDYSPEALARASLAEELGLPSTLRPDEKRAPSEPAEAALEVATASLDDLGDLGLLETAPDQAIAGEPGEPADARPAAAQLGDHQLIEAWTARAEWFEEEAKAASDAGARARLLLAASELRAMAGSTGLARELAKKAVQAKPSVSLASRQVRNLCAAEGDWKSVSSLLDVEAHSAPDEASRAHAAYVASEIQRIHLGDAKNAERRLDIVARTASSDPRPALMKLATALLGKEPPGGITWPEGPGISPLVSAASELALARGFARSAGDTHPSPPVALHEVRRALAAGDATRAATLLVTIASVRELQDGARLLAASLLAPTAEGRAQAIELLSALARDLPDAALRRALSARALEQGDAGAMQRALAPRGEDDHAFLSEDRVALAALSGGDGAELGASVAALAATDELRPLAAGATAVLSRDAVVPVGDEKQRAEMALGRRLLVPDADALREPVQKLAATAPDDPLPSLLELDGKLRAGSSGDVAEGVSRLARAEDGVLGRLAAAFIREAAGDAAPARDEYTAALGGSALAEAAARALTPAGDPHASDLLSMLAASLGEETTVRQALLLYEAALRADAAEPEAALALLLRSHEASPELPLAARFAGDLLRATGDAAGLLSWIGKQKDAATDPRARALHAVREAFLLADEDAATAAASLRTALPSRPLDAALHEFLERLDRTPAVENGEWREELAKEATDPVTRGVLLLGAARAFERAGALDAANRATLAAAEGGGSEIARVLAGTLARDHVAVPLEGLVATRTAEQSLLGHPGEELEETAQRLIDLEDAREAGAHARLASRLRVRRDTWESTADYVSRAARHTPRSLWTLRAQAAHAEARGEHELAAQAERELAERNPVPLDAATLYLRAAERLAKAGKSEEALALVSRTIEAAPEHLVARNVRARLLEAEGKATLAAEDLEAVAGASAVPEHRVEAWYEAARLLLASEETRARGVTALERVADEDITYSDAFEKLQKIYGEAGDRAKLSSLLEKRLSVATTDDERIDLEITRSRALVDLGDRDAARRALEGALEAAPNHQEALQALGDLCFRSEDWQGAEDAWIRLAKASTAPEKQAEVYRLLASLYVERIPNRERAEIALREVLKRLPDDVAALEGLVAEYVRAGDVTKAVETQTLLIDRAVTPDEKRDRTLRLAQVHDEAAKDKKTSFAILDRARKAAPHDPVVLAAMAQHHRFHGETAAMSVLLDRASAEARRALAHGRFDPSFFGMLRACAEIRGETDSAAVAAAALRALEGDENASVKGAGPRAADPALADLLAPEPITAAFRALVSRLAGVLDAAFPADPKALRAALPSPGQAGIGDVRALSTAMGIPSLELLVSPSLGGAAVAVSSAPPRLVVAQSVLESPESPARTFALLRALALVKTEVSVLARLPAIELWPVTAGLLRVLAPSFVPQGVDAGKLKEAEDRIRAAMTRKPDDDMATLALEVGGALGNRASQIGQAVAQWASRTALLWTGDSGASIRGIALSVGQADRLPADPAERLKWVLRQPEARDLCVFSVSDAYAEARKRSGAS